MSSFPDALGASIPRLEARDKLVGTAHYVDDFVRPNMLHAAIVKWIGSVTWLRSRSNRASRPTRKR